MSVLPNDPSPRQLDILSSVRIFTLHGKNSRKLSGTYFGCIPDSINLLL